MGRLLIFIDFIDGLHKNVTIYAMISVGRLLIVRCDVLVGCWIDWRYLFLISNASIGMRQRYIYENKINKKVNVDAYIRIITIKNL